jgi:hypothetical protein
LVACGNLPAAGQNLSQEQRTFLDAALAGPLKDIEEIIFCTRLAYDDPHWYANIGHYCDDEQHKAYAGNGKPDVGRLLALNIRTNTVRTIFDAQGGSIRDPQVHYDGQKILFSYRKAGQDHYHLYEINVDGSGLRQLTSGPYDDYEPSYLPDGSIVFVSTRCRSWVKCWMTQVGVLYRCDADGSNIRRISFNNEHDNTPWPLPDGRILYTRWEYVDRSQVEFHHLWAMNPDGTVQTIFFGNMHPGIVMIDAKPIPGTNEVLACFSPGHGVTDHKGIATIVSPAAGPDHLPSAQRLHSRPLIQDPYPISADCFLMSDGKRLILMNRAGLIVPIFVYSGEGELREPRPLIGRPRERLIASRVDWNRRTGRMILADVYRGRNMEGVRRGEIKKLLILEDLPKPVNFSGGPDLISWLGTFSLERVLGTVPVEEDGSAYFEVPAGRAIYFVALDENEFSVKRMHSFTSVMPGEVVGCVGCHEQRTSAPDALRVMDLLAAQDAAPGGDSAAGLVRQVALRNRERAPGPVLMALRRHPSKIQPFEGFPDVLDFPRDIQPILDRHCVSCHNYQRREGKVILAGDLGQNWSHSYYSMFAHNLVADGRDGLGNHPPRTIGSSASRLLKLIDEHHAGVDLSPRERRLIWLWIESGAPYAGSYAGLRNAEQQAQAGKASGMVFGQGRAILKRRCGECHNVDNPRDEAGRPLPFEPITAGNSRGLSRRTAVYERVILPNDPIARFGGGILLNFTRPAMSPLLLGPLARSAGGWESCGPVFASTADPDYQALLSLIERGKAELDATPRYGSPGFQPNRQYVREMKRFGILPPNFQLGQQPVDIFALDQAYWRSLWPWPE